MSKKPKNSRNSFSPDFNSEENDFILVDLDINQNEDDLTLVPLNNFLEDEEVINSLLVPQDLDDKLQYDSLSKAKLIDDIDVADEFLDNNQFNIGSFEQVDQNLFPGIETEKVNMTHIYNDLDESEKLKESINHLILESGYDLDPELLEEIHETIEIHDFRRSHDFEYNLNEQNMFASNKANLGSEVIITKPDSQFSNQVVDNKSDSHVTIQESIDTKAFNKEKVLSSINVVPEKTQVNNANVEQEVLKKQLSDYEQKIKKADRITYASLSFGVVALISVAVIGLIAFNLQSKVSKLSDLNAILEENMGDFAENAPPMYMNNNDQTIEQVNPNQPKEINNTQASIIEPENNNPAKKQLEPVITTQNSALEKPVQEKIKPSIDTPPKLSQTSKEKTQSSSDLAKNNVSTVVKKPAVITGSIEKKKALKPSTFENTKPKEIVAKTQANEKISIEKKPIVKEPLKAKPQAFIIAPKKEAPGSLKKSSDNTLPVKQNTKPTPIVDNKKPTEVDALSTTSKNKLKADGAESQWSVNLIAFEDQAIAKSKAAKFIENGIQVKITDIKKGNKTWYQLKVKGFKTKESAESYAVKVKKSQNLNTVSVSQ
ncbi:MAG: SPOR domain-containing protein [Methylococcales bacterium]|nr:SPOR domain-containing protein [Methylococcales bacterium]